MLLKVQGFCNSHHGFNQKNSFSQSNNSANLNLVTKADTVKFGRSLENKFSGYTLDIFKWVTDIVKKCPVLEKGPNKGCRVYAGTLSNGVKHEIKMIDGSEDVLFKLEKPDDEDIIFSANLKSGVINSGNRLSPLDYNNAVESVHKFFWLGRA